MTDKSFDPYHQWLGIPKNEQPPDHYRLLGVTLFESDANVVEAAANRQMAYVKQCGTGPHSAASQKLLNELSTARITLLNADKKSAYDSQLKAKQQPAEVPVPDFAPPIVVTDIPEKPGSVRPTKSSSKQSSLGVIIAVVLGGVVTFGIYELLTKSESDLPAGDPIAATTPEQPDNNPNRDESQSGRDNEPSTQASGGRKPTDDSSTTNIALLNPDKPKPNTTVATKNTKPPINPTPPLATANEPPKPGSRPYLQFQGQSYVELANTAGLLDLNGSFTIEMWVKIPNVSSKQVQFIAGDEAWPGMNRNVTAEGASGWVLRKREGKLEFTMGVGGKNWYSPSGILSNSDDWQYIRIEKTGTSVGGFANGETVFSSNSRERKFVPSPTNIFLGVREFAADDRSSDVAIRAFRLTASTPYRGNYSVPNSFEKDAETAALLDFSKGTGTQLADLSGNGHHGTISGAQWKQESTGDSAIAQTAGQSVDLLKKIDPKRDVVGGNFSMENGNLTWKRAYQTRLQIPGDVPDEYDLVVTSIRTDGDQGLMIGLVVGGHQALAVIDDASGNGFHYLDGKVYNQNESHNSERGLFKPGKESTVICSVRKSSVKVTFEGKTVLDWKGDPVRFGDLRRWAVPNKQALFIGGNAVHSISKLELRPVGSSGSQTGSAESLANRKPIPDADDLKKSETLIKDLFKDDYKNAKSSSKKAELGKRLLQKATESRDNVIDRYVMLAEARRIATAGGDAETALTATELLTAEFEIEALESKVETIVALGKSTRFPAQKKPLAEKAFVLIDEAIAVDDYKTATQLATIALGAARGARLRDFVKVITARRKEVAEVADEFEKTTEAFASLKENPDDPAANLAVGSFLCFYKGDWEQGLPMFVKSGDETLKALAEKDLAKPTAAEQRVVVGDGWWELAQDQRAGARKQTEAHATQWYVGSLLDLTGLLKLRIEKRLTELEDKGLLDAIGSLKRKVIITASGNNGHTIYLNGSPLMTCRREKASSKSTILKVGDLITIKVGDRFDIMSLWMFFQTEQKEKLFETSDRWTAYRPANLQRWWEIGGEKLVRQPAQYAPTTREYVNLVMSSAETALPKIKKSLPIYSVLQGEGGYNATFIYYVVTAKDLLPNNNKNTKKKK